MTSSISPTPEQGKLFSRLSHEEQHELVNNANKVILMLAVRQITGLNLHSPDLSVDERKRNVATLNQSLRDAHLKFDSLDKKEKVEWIQVAKQLKLVIKSENKLLHDLSMSQHVKENFKFDFNRYLVDLVIDAFYPK